MSRSNAGEYAIEQFLSRVAMPASYEQCWTWTGKPTQGTGYGRFRMEGRTLKAHVAAYELAIGPVPEGLELDHLCRVRLCVNPLHLEAVTSRENACRAVAVRRRHVPANHCVNGHEMTPENTRYEATGKRRCCECSRAKHRRWLERKRSTK